MKLLVVHFYFSRVFFVLLSWILYFFAQYFYLFLLMFQLKYLIDTSMHKPNCWRINCFITFFIHFSVFLLNASTRIYSRRGAGNGLQLTGVRIKIDALITKRNYFLNLFILQCTMSSGGSATDYVTGKSYFQYFIDS